VLKKFSLIFLDPKGANNQIRDKFDSTIRSHQQAEQPSGAGGNGASSISGIRAREEFEEEEDDVSLDDDELVATLSNDNNNSSGGLDESEISMNQDH
jgi:hypothetical protein